MAVINFPILYIPNPIIGRPLFNCQIFVGEPDLDPEIPVNQKQLNVIQEDGTVVAVPQPFVTSAGGVPTYNGATVRLDVEGNYSLKILDNLGAQKYYIENVFEGQPITEEELPLLLSQTINFSDVAEYKAFTKLLPVTKRVYLADRDAYFSVTSGTGTATTFDIIASSVTGQSIELVDSPIVYMRNLGAMGDGVADDINEFLYGVGFIAGTTKVLSGKGESTLLTGVHTITTTGDIRLSDFNIKAGNDYTDQPQIKIDSDLSSVYLEDITIDGDRLARTATEQWYERPNAGGNQGVSIWPTPLDFLWINANYLYVNNYKAIGVHATSALVSTAYATNISNVHFENSSFDTLIVSDRDSGSSVNLSNYFALNCSQLPENYSVLLDGAGAYVAANRDADDYFAQGAFGARLLVDKSNVNNFIAREYGSAALVLDKGTQHNISNINIHHTLGTTVSNNPSSPIFVEAGEQVNGTNIEVRIEARGARENDAAAIYAFVRGSSSTTPGDDDFADKVSFSNVNLYIADGVGLAHGFRGIYNGGGSVSLDNFAMYAPTSGANLAIHCVLNYPTESGGTASFSNGTIEGGGDVRIRDCNNQTIHNVQIVQPTIDNLTELGRQSGASGDIHITDSSLGGVVMQQPSGKVFIGNSDVQGNLLLSSSGANAPSTVVLNSVTVTGGRFEIDGVPGVSNGCIIDSCIWSYDFRETADFRDFSSITVTNSMFKQNDGDVNCINVAATYTAMVANNTIISGLTGTGVRYNAGVTDGSGVTADVNNIALKYDWVTNG